MSTIKKAKVTKTTLTDSEIRELGKLFEAYKKAEKVFRERRDEMTDGLKEGKYIGKKYTVNKSSHLRNYVDHKAILEAHPEIDIDMFTTTKRAELITITANN